MDLVRVLGGALLLALSADLAPPRVVVSPAEQERARVKQETYSIVRDFVS